MLQSPNLTYINFTKTVCADNGEAAGDVYIPGPVWFSRHRLRFRLPGLCDGARLDFHVRPVTGPTFRPTGPGMRWRPTFSPTWFEMSSRPTLSPTGPGMSSARDDGSLAWDDDDGWMKNGWIKKWVHNDDGWMKKWVHNDDGWMDGWRSAWEEVGYLMMMDGCMDEKVRGNEIMRVDGWRRGRSRWISYPDIWKNGEPVDLWCFLTHLCMMHKVPTSYT